MSTAEGKLYDRLHERYGIGEPISEDEQTWKIKAREVSKIKSMMKKRGVGIESLHQALDYAEKHGRIITASWELFGLIPDAKSELRAQAAAAPTPVREQLADAAAAAYEAGEYEWAERLTAADDAEGGQAALSEWTAR